MQLSFFGISVSLSDVDTSEKEKKRLQANAKKPALVAKEKASNPLREKMKSAVRKRNEQMQSRTPGAVTSSEGNVAQKQTTLKDLCPEDKQRVANLIKELARLGEEKENAMSQLAQQKAVYEEQTKELAKEKEKMKLDREAVELQLKECQLLLDKYQKFLSEQQEKRSFTNGNDVEKDLTNPELHVKENKTGIPKEIKQIQRNKASHDLLEEARNPVSDAAVHDIQIPDFQSNVSYSSETQVTSLAASNPVLSRDLQCDHYLAEKFSFQRPVAVASGDSGRNLISKEQVREPTSRQPVFTDLNPKKQPMTGPLNRPNLSSTQCSEYKTDDRFPIEMQFGSGNDRKTSVPILSNARLLDQCMCSSTADEEIYRETDLKNPAAFLAKPKTSDLVNRMTLANRTEYNEVNRWPPLCNAQSNGQFEEAIEPFLLSRDPDDCLLQSKKSGFDVSFNSIPTTDESERQGKTDSLNVGHKDPKQELLAQRKALLDEQRRLNEALLSQEAFFKQQEHELRLLQEAQHRSRFNVGLGVQSSDIHEMKRDEECCFTSRCESSRHSQKPVHLVDADLSCDQRFPRLVSAATSPVKHPSLRTLSTEVNPQRDRAKIPPSILSSSTEESKTSRPILKSSKLSREIQEHIDGKKFQRILQTKQMQPVSLSRGSSDLHRVVPNSCLMSRSSQAYNDNDSDSSLEDSKIIEDLFFVK